MPDRAVTTTAENLRRILRAVLPATGRDWTLPVVRCVRLHSAETALCATATDRYALAQARCEEATGTLPAVLLDRRDVKRVLRLIERPADSGKPVALTVGHGDRGQTLTVRLVTVAPNGVSITVDAADRQWPAENLANLMAKVPTRQACGTDQPLAFDIWGVERMLRGLRRVGTPDRSWGWVNDKRGGHTVRVYAGKPGQPTRIECGDWFVAIVQPVDRDRSNRDYAAMAGVPLEIGEPADRAAAGGGVGNPATEDQPPPTPTQTEG